MSSDLSKNRLLVLLIQMVIIVLMTTFCGWFVFFEDFYSVAFKTKHDAIQSDVSEISKKFSDQSKSILEYTDLYHRLRGNRKVVEGDQKLFGYLSWIKKKFGADVVYLMSPTGSVIEATNRHDKVSFLGKNYSFRDYFIQAKEGDTFVQMGMGRTSGIPGAYFSAGINLTGDRTKHVLVAKTNLVPAATEKIFPEDLSYIIISKTNDILLARDKNLIGKSVVISPDSELGHIYGSTSSKVIYSYISNSSGWKIGAIVHQGPVTSFFKKKWKTRAVFLPIFIFLLFLIYKLVRQIAKISSDITAINIQRDLILSTFNSIENPIWIVDPDTSMTVIQNRACDKDSIRALCGENNERCSFTSNFLHGTSGDTAVMEGNDKRFYEFHSVLTPLDGKNYFINQLIDITERVHYQQKKDHEKAKMFHDERVQNMGRMISNITHELNNPLTSVIIGFDRLFAMLDDEKTDDVVNLIRRNIERMNRVVKMLLAFVRQAKSKRDDVSINEMFENCLILLGREILASDISVKKNGIEGIVLNCMPVALETIILNFAKNSIDAFEENPDTKDRFISLEFEQHSSSIELIFTDNAGGIPEDITDKIFDPFFTTKEEGKGTGIGMHMTKEMVQDMGGDVFYDRDYKGGARFVVTFPIKMLVNEQ